MVVANSGAPDAFQAASARQVAAIEQAGARDAGEPAGC
jgi:hypothetical protein